MGAFAEFLVRLRREKPLAVVLGIVLLLLIGVALLADVLAPFGPNEVFLMDRLQGSSARYPLGTDQLGRDFASRLIYGARLTLGVGLGRHRGERAGGAGGGRRVRLHRRPARPDRAAAGRCLDVDSRPADPADGDVGGGPGGAADHRGAGGAGRHRRLAGGPRRGDRRQGAGLLRGGAGGRQLALADARAPPAAEHRAGADRDLQHQHRGGGDQRGVAELPGVRAADHGAELGRHAEPGRGASTWRSRRGWRCGRACA